MFSDFERLSLLNQYTVLSKVDPKGGWETFAEILERGFTSEYVRLTDHLMPPMPEHEQQFVVDVLSMYDALQRPWYGKSDQVPSDRTLPGFNGAAISYYQFLVKDGRFAYLVLASPHGDPDAHIPFISEMYVRMLAKWKEFSAPMELSETQAEQILAERAHPDNR